MNSSRGALLKGTSKMAFIMSQYEVSDCIRLVRLLDFISLQYDEDGIFIAGRALARPPEIDSREPEGILERSCFDTRSENWRDRRRERTAR